MDSYKSYQYFKDRFRVSKSTNGWYLMDCPECNQLGKKRVLRINFNHGWLNCMSASCGWNRGSRLIDFVMDKEGLSYVAAKEFVSEYEEGYINLREEFVDDIGGTYRNKVIELPKGYKTILEGKGLIADRARDYLTGRGFDLEILDRMGVGYCNENNEDYKKNYFGYIILPFKKENKLYYYNGRDFIGNVLRYKNPGKEELGVGKADLMFNEDCMNFKPEVFIMEGVFDAMSLEDNAVAIQGKFLSTVQKTKILQSRCNSFVVCLDDKFYKDSLRLAAQLIEHKTVYALRLEGGDPNELGAEVIKALRLKAEPLTFVEIMKGLEEKDPEE